jgi:hypothetical protein
MKSYSLTLQTTLMVSALAACGQGTFIYDQSSATNRSVSGGVAIQEEQPVGQSFTPALSSVGFVQLEFLDANPGNGLGATVYVNLRADSITGTILGSTDPVAMPDRFYYGITNFFFSTPVAVSPGTVYFLQPVVQSGDSQWAVADGPYNYPGGTGFEYGQPDPNGFDEWFREGVLTPEPSSGLLILAGFGGMFIARRFRRRAREAHLLLVLAVGAAASIWSTSAQTPQTNSGVSYYSAQKPEWPPMPIPTPGCAVLPIAGRPGCWQMQDLDYDYAAVQLAASMNRPDGQTPDGPLPLDYGTNLWLEITGIDEGNVSITAHNVVEDNYFQLLSRTNAAEEVGWTIEQQFTVVGSGIENLPLAAVPENGRTAAFFWAAEAQTKVKVYQGDNAIRPGPCYAGQHGTFTFHREGYVGNELPMAVSYRVSGTATNGVDYTFLNGSTNIPDGQSDWSIEVNAVSSPITSNLTVTVTLVMTNGYIVDSNSPSATILVEPNVFSLVASLPNPVGLDYDTLTNSLLVSVDPSLAPGTNFVRIDTNGLVSLWADMADLGIPVTIATVKTNRNGFVEGDMYYGTFDVDPDHIGWLSGDASHYSSSWAPLWGYVVPVGGLYVDQSGTFAGDLIASTGGDYTGSGDPGSVWRIDALGNATNIAYFPMSLGGVITLTNDVAQWGPWAGRIITGQGPEDFLDHPEIYAVDTNGQVTTYTNLGIQPEHFNLIPPNQPFYCCDSVSYAVWKVPAAVFTNHVGQLLITGMGQVGYDPPPALYIVHWDAGVSNFVAEKIDTPDFVGCLEDGTFAPIEIPCLPQ